MRSSLLSIICTIVVVTVVVVVCVWVCLRVCVCVLYVDIRSMKQLLTVVRHIPVQDKLLTHT